MEKSTAYLQERRTGDLVEAEIWDDISDEHVGLWKTSWIPHIKASRTDLELANVPKANWPQDLHWSWEEKADWSKNLLSVRRFSIICGKQLQGLMLVNLTKLTARIPEQKGRDLAYIDYLSTAPWNRADLTNEPIYRGVGTVMVRVAAEVSKLEGFRGRIGLHSLPQAAKFYGNVCGMTELGKDPAYQNLVYFEMNERQAAQFCGKNIDSFVTPV